MTLRTWVILGATSIIAEEFANLAAKANNHLVLVGRNTEQLEIIKANIQLRYAINCDLLIVDFAKNYQNLLQFFHEKAMTEIDLFIAHSLILDNEELNLNKIAAMIQINVLSTVQIIHSYLQKKQENYRLIYLSSVATNRGRNKNSLYAGTKAALETYLEGLQQKAKNNLQITIAKLGFIDTIQTYGKQGIFYASPPKACAKACWKATKKGKRLIYHPFFWRYLMAIISHLPFFIYKRMKF